MGLCNKTGAIWVLERSGIVASLPGGWGRWQISTPFGNICLCKFRSQLQKALTMLRRTIKGDFL